MKLTELQGMPVFPAADKFPKLQELEHDYDSGGKRPGPLTRLADDIDRHGLIHPVWTYQGQLLDGRNRIAAAALIGLDELATREYEGDTPVQFVVSLNVERRHLDKSALAIMAVLLEQDFGDEARAREVSGGKLAAQGEAIHLAAHSLGVGQTIVEKAKALSRMRIDLFRKVEAGQMTVTAAYERHQATALNQNDEGEWIETLRANDDGKRVLASIQVPVPGSPVKRTEYVKVAPELTVPQSLEKAFQLAVDVKQLWQAFMDVASEEEADNVRRLADRIGLMFGDLG